MRSFKKFFPELIVLVKCNIFFLENTFGFKQNFIKESKNKIHTNLRDTHRNLVRNKKNVEIHVSEVKIFQKCLVPSFLIAQAKI